MTGYNAEFLDGSELTALGIGSVGDRVLIHRTAVLVNCQNLKLASNIRIDPFVVISAGTSVRIGRNVHIAAYASIIGAGEVDVGDFVGLAQGVRILASSDDFSGTYLTGPTISGDYKNVISAGVSIGRHAVVGAGQMVTLEKPRAIFLSPRGGFESTEGDARRAAGRECSSAKLNSLSDFLQSFVAEIHMRNAVQSSIGKLSSDRVP